MSTFKRVTCLLLALVMTFGMLPAWAVTAHAEDAASVSDDHTGHADAPAAAAPMADTTVIPSGSGENNSCKVHGSLSGPVDLTETLPAIPITITIGDGQDTAMNYANSDLEAYTADWCYGIGSETGLLYREAYDLTGRQDLTDTPVSQITALGSRLYALVQEDGACRIMAADEDSLQWDTLCLSDSRILRFAVTGDSLFYLTEQTLFRQPLDGSAAAETLLQAEGLCRFWLASDSLVEYIAADETVICQYELSTGETYSYANQISRLDETLPDNGGDAAVTGLSLSSMRSKFPHGKYWNHAGNPGSSNSVNNQNGYTSTPCSVHGVVGTSQQTCNGFQPGSTQLSWQCMGYAEKLGYDASGYNPRNNANGWYTYTSTSALDSLKAGDIVRYKNNGHSIYVIGVNGDTVTYTDCNSDGHCIIRWDATISKSTLRSTFTNVRSAPSSLTPEPVSCTCSTSYAGNYTCTTSSSNLNMRSGHGTGYSIVTSIPSGATVYVSKASGTGSSAWAHVEYNGYSGYASMQYLTKQSDTTTRNSVISSWLSDSEMGNSVSSVRTGEWLYLCYKVYDKNTGDMFDTYNTSGYSVTLKLYGPSGDVEHSYTFTNDNNWISIRRTVPGTYRGEITFTFDSGGTTTVERTATMVYEPRVTPSPSDVSLSVLGINSETVSISYSGATNSSTIYVKAAATTGNCFTYSWGSWTDHIMPLTITGTRAGTGTITIGLYDSDTDEQLATSVINIRVEAPSYTVTYNANGGSNAPSSQTKDYGVSLTLSSTVPTRFGYTFLGWATSSSATSAAYRPGASFTSNANTTLYAVWQAPTTISSTVTNSSYSVSIIFANGTKYYKFVPSYTSGYRFESSGDLDTKIYLYNASGTQLATDDDSGDSTNFLLDYDFTAGTTYYLMARMYSTGTGTISFTAKRLYDVTYNANGGSGAPAAQTKVHGTSLTLSSTVPTRTGYTFQGWATSSTATTATYQAGGSFSSNANTTLYAVWKPITYTVTFNANGGSGAPASQTKTHGVTLTLSTTTPSRTGYTFQGWATSASATSAAYQPGGSFTTNANTTLYAVWKPITYTITYNANGGSGAPSNQTKTHGVTLTLSSTLPTRSGYAFQGWATSSTATSAAYQAGGSFTTNANTTLYAVWTQNTYTVSYNANGGSGAPSSQIKYGGTALTLTTSLPTRMGYTFLGWSTSASATSAAYLPGGSFTTDANTTLYAVWKAATTISSSLTSTSCTAAVSFAGGYQYYSFTPSYTGKLQVESSGSSDTIVYLYDASGNQLASNDDGGTDRNFLLTYDVTAKSQYYIKVKYYGSTTGTISFTAKRGYDVTYHANGGSGAPAAQVKLYGTTLTLSSTVPTRTGYTFQGWAASASAASAAYQAGGSYTANAAATLYAVWTSNCDNGHSYGSYTVSKTPTTSTTGTLTGTCSRCGGTTTVTLPKLNTTDYAYRVVTAAACTTTGTGRYTWNTTTYGTYSFDVTIAKLGHNYVSGSCTRCGAKDPDYTVVASGWSGDLTWALSPEGTLTFSGSGKMKNYTYKSEMPWYGYLSQINAVVLESGVTSIGDYAFYGMTALKTITIPQTVTAIGSYAFKNATALNGVTLPSKLTKLGESAFYGCTALTAMDIPASLYTVQPYTFKNCTALASLTFHEGNLMKISDGAFYNTALTTLVLPDCLSILDVYAFKNCAKLSSITLGSGLTQIREAAFYGTPIPTIVIPEGVTSIGPYAFKNCTRLVSMDLPSTLTSIGEASFYACTALESLDLPNAVTKIGNYAFRKCAALMDVSFGTGLVTIGESSFYGCESIVYLSIPSKVTTIGGYAFKGCSDLEIVNLSSALTTLGDSAFHTCTSLSEITIPAKVTKIGEYCFSGSTGIDYFTFLGSAPTIGTGAFNKITATAYYPSGNSTWTASVRQNYGGSITWTAQ